MSQGYLTGILRGGFHQKRLAASEILLSRGHVVPCSIQATQLAEHRVPLGFAAQNTCNSSNSGGKRRLSKQTSEAGKTRERRRDEFQRESARRARQGSQKAFFLHVDEFPANDFGTDQNSSKGNWANTDVSSLDTP